MKNKGLIIIPALVAAISVPYVASAHKNVGTFSKAVPSTGPSINAVCAEATAQSDLAVNNVRCRVLMGDMWWDLANGIYEIPKGGGIMSIFAGSLWVGGIDNGGNLMVAAQTYRQTGNDFWPGPLDTTTAIADQDVCAKYDKHFRITRKEVEDFVANGTITPAISNWPGNGDQSLGQGKYLAPFYDANGDGQYTPSAGDYPGYDLVAGDGYGECAAVNCVPVDQLFGDETIWWVFNDKGNIHTETGGQAIGLEIRAQAFGFFTDDEINNMTFYNYRIFNRSSNTVDSCYFGVWCDADLGCYTDDFVGCDVERGLGYTYNGDNDDEVNCSSPGYGLNPPAIGIDFFRGPIADAGDGKDNNRNCSTDEACEQIIMSGFLYYDNINGSPFGNPSGATHFYNYLKMKWGDGNDVQYGGNGYQSGGPKCNFMFPGSPSTDAHDWGIGGNCSTAPTLPAWDEVAAGNTPADRRMLESAGPFTLLPGAVNVITTGVAWARANSGGAQASVTLLRVTDDKAQALFDNCFKVLDGPNAPDVSVQELDKEIILLLSNNDPTSNNYNENYSEFDPLIALIDTGGNLVTVDTTYNFQGYKIFQLKDYTVSGNDLENPDKARLIYQCDVKDGISRIINYEFDQSLGAAVPKEKVDGKNTGVAHSIRVVQDAFATGSPDLINHRTYYFMAVAYGHNEYKKYQQDMPPGPDPFAPAFDGQKKPYKQGRKNLKVYSAIPHPVLGYSQGTTQVSEYGNGPEITRMEGNGNGGVNISMNAASISAIMSSSSHRIVNPTYEPGAGPIKVKVVDPLNVPDGHNFTLKFVDTNATFVNTNLSNCAWVLTNNTTGEVINSDKTIKLINEQLLLQWGLSIAIEQPADPGGAKSPNGLLSASITYADPSKKWLSGVADQDGPYYQNWIRSGTTTGSDAFQNDYAGTPNPDEDAVYETILGATWAPYRLTACTDATMSSGYVTTKYYGGPGFKTNFMNQPQMKDLASVDIVLTSDKSKWTRAVVLEMCEDPGLAANTVGAPTPARKMDYRRAASVDKNGVANFPAPDNNDFATGMGWFPGYAVNHETGERLNIAFGENSALVKHNGNDMLWNPTTKQTDSIPWATGKTGPVFGGQHYIYVFGHNKDNSPTGVTPVDTINVPRYDAGKRIREILDWDNGQPVDPKKRELYRDAMWVNIPLLASGQSLLSTDATIRLRVSKTYKIGYSPAYYQNGTATIYTDTNVTAVNNDLPMYNFSTNGLATVTTVADMAETALDMIRVVPNPYYAFSYYETSNLDNRVKITNLPEKCTVSIFNLAGTLIRKYEKGQAYTNHAAFNAAVTTSANQPLITTWDGSLDWDLKNSAGIPISGGVYVIHVDVPGVGEKVIKWFGIMRPIDLDSF